MAPAMVNAMQAANLMQAADRLLEARSRKLADWVEFWQRHRRQ
jgi:hypothetical protein